MNEEWNPELKTLSQEYFICLVKLYANFIRTVIDEGTTLENFKKEMVDSTCKLIDEIDRCYMNLQ